MTVHTQAQVIGWARQAIKIEQDALSLASDNISGDFVEAVESIVNIEGKIICTGMGKSGHIARKIAATLSSTGTSSFFVHPAEALHGDFGMITERDVLLSIAFGGETREVVEVARFARRLGSTVISITGNTASTLAGLSSFVLNGSVSKEACPLNLAPTASTTVALALGDALAVALMRSRGFEEQDFAKFHPEGSLGRRLAIVRQHMIPASHIESMNHEDDFHSILEKVTQGNFGICPVVDPASGSLQGVITDGDIRRAMLRYEGEVFHMNAGQLMSKKPKTVCANSLAVDAFGTMEKASITALMVVSAEDKNPLVGIIRMHDLLAAKIV